MYDDMEQQGQQPPQELRSPQQEASNAAWDDYVNRTLDPGEDFRREAFDDAIAQAVAPQLEALALEREVGELVREHPALDDPEVAQAVVEAAQQRAREIGHPEAWRDPRLIRMVFLGEGGEEAFRPQRSLADQIIQAHPSGRPSIFR